MTVEFENHIAALRKGEALVHGHVQRAAETLGGATGQGGPPAGGPAAADAARDAEEAAVGNVHKLFADGGLASGKAFFTRFSLRFVRAYEWSAAQHLPAFDIIRQARNEVRFKGTDAAHRAQRHKARCRGQGTWGSFISRALRGGVQ